MEDPQDYGEGELLFADFNEGAAATGVAEKLACLGASIIADATGGAGVLNARLIRFSGSGTVAGRAVAAECSEGSPIAALTALDHAEPGDILCMTAPGATACLGHLLASEIVNRRLAAVVVDGLIRDRDTLSRLPVSIFARGVTPAARRGSDPGRSMGPIRVGGVEVKPGDWIVADGDGVVVIPAPELEAVLEQAEEDARIEARVMARIKAGACVLDVVNEELGSVARGD
jgi:4-hydroxy-4-methyl-2-oxoglutarate aldolase